MKELVFVFVLILLNLTVQEVFADLEFTPKELKQSVAGIYMIVFVIVFGLIIYLRKRHNTQNLTS